ncbi:hypothetical protein BDF22DRAFT_734944 [Syncephalis plumigaleata]|nr:hypothetical protein BDF22DRAFT_734944 [Syncephalis plumigaleata]
MVPWTKLASVAVLGLCTLQNVAGHMKFFAPIARGDFRIKDKYGMVDNDLNAPINADDFPADFPCRHTKVGPVTAKYTAGKSFAVMFKRVSLEYVHGSCPWTYHIPLPKGAKNGKALFAWGWMNAEGNREYYMNCADVEIDGGSEDGSLTGPELFVGQLEGKPKIPEWAYTDGKKSGVEHFINRKVITIPTGAKATREGTVVGEACNGHKAAKMPPAKVPWDRFRNDDGDHSDDSVKTFFIATSDNPGPGVTGDSEAKYPYVKGEDYVIPIDEEGESKKDKKNKKDKSEDNGSDGGSEEEDKSSKKRKNEDDDSSSKKKKKKKDEDDDSSSSGNDGSQDEE